MSGKRNVSVCSGHELANALYFTPSFCHVFLAHICVLDSSTHHESNPFVVIHDETNVLQKSDTTSPWKLTVAHRTQTIVKIVTLNEIHSAN